VKFANWSEALCQMPPSCWSYLRSKVANPDDDGEREKANGENNACDDDDYVCLVAPVHDVRLVVIAMQP
jgi:hypothetical protein